MSGDGINSRQYLALMLFGCLAPMLRRMPRALAQTAGFAAWLSIIICIAPAALMIALHRLLLRSSREGRGMCGILRDTLGRGCGSVFIALYAGWMLYLAGYVLRGGAERFVTTIYPSSDPLVFMAVTLAACLFAAMGSLKAIARTAMVFRPWLLAALVLVFAFSLPDAKLSGLWQPAPGSGPDVVRGCLAALEPLCFPVCVVFVQDLCRERLSARRWLPWFVTVFIAEELLYICVIGLFGPALTAQLSNPFFSMVRGVSLFGAIERVEAVVVTLWVFSDFVYFSLLIFMASRSLRFLLGLPETERPRIFDLSRGRWLTVVCAAAAFAVGCCMGLDTRSFNVTSSLVTPLVNLFFAFAMPTLALVIGRARRRI